MVSVIVPIYNAELYLERMIQSVLNQKSDNFELILVDDGSTDDSYRICKQYEEADERIKLICQENSGVSVARNTGLQVASGDYIAFCDADDYYEPDYLSTFECLSKTEDADLFVFGAYIDYPEKTPVVHQPPIICKDSIHGVGEAVESWFDIYWMGLWNKVYKKKIIEENGIRFKNGIRYDEDSIFNLTYLSVCRNIFCSSKPEYHYVQQNVTSLTRTFSSDRLETVKQVEEKLIELACQNNLNVQKVKKACQSRKLDMAYAQLYMLMSKEMDNHERKMYAHNLKAETANMKCAELISNGWRNIVFRFPYVIIRCYFFVKKFRKRVMR